jgi:ABC-type multidrug transport system fused ATPase/permease subunit
MLKRLLPLKPYLACYRKRYVLGFLCLIVAQGVGITPPLIIKAGIDALRQRQRRQLFLYAGALGGGLVKAVFQFWQRWF